MKQYIAIDKVTRCTGAMDFGFLTDAPAGRHGFVRVRDGHLYFEDGKRAVFFGFNLATRAALPDHASARAMAERFRSMGVNCIRICAVDAPPSDRKYAWAAEKGHALLDYENGTTRAFNADGLDRFDYFASCLKENGIYLHFDLNVARGYLPGDGLDYPVEGMLPTQKMIQILNRRLIALQKEYAENFLTHVNPYTGIAYRDEPQVMCLQVTNEDTMFLNPVHMRRKGHDAYLEEMQRRFGYFLLAKYGSRAHLAEAWTDEKGICALEEDEDPADGTVKLITPSIPYNVWPNVSDGRGDALRTPARFADLNEFGIQVTRDYYREMFSHLHALGVRVPIAATNLVHGAAEVYAANEADIMQINPYWNHPFAGEIPDLHDKVSTDPRIFSVWDPMHQPGHQELQMTQASVTGKPLMLTEWNEYGSVKYNSASFPMMMAYACLQDIDAILIYCYASNESDAFADPGDRVHDIMESFNDPGLIAHFGALSYAFLTRAFAPARVRAEIWHTPADLRTLPSTYVAPYAAMSFISRLSMRFSDGREHYDGDADVAVAGGYTPTGDLTEAKHAIVWCASSGPERKRYIDMHREEGAREILDGKALLGEKRLVFTAAEEFKSDPYLFSSGVDIAMREWGLWHGGSGVTDDGMVSDTGEIRYEYGKGRFSADSANCAFFAGNTSGGFCLGGIRVNALNERLTASLVPLDGKELDASKHLLLTLTGEAGNADMRFEGKRFLLDGKLTCDMPEGEVCLKGAARAYVCDIYGNRLYEADAADGKLHLTGDGGVNIEIMYAG